MHILCADLQLLPETTTKEKCIHNVTEYYIFLT